jgi:GWxTD domain-containing protein
MTRSTTFRLLAAVLLLAAAAASVTAQPGSGEETFVKSERKAFSVDVLTYLGDSAGLTRVDLYVELPYNSLQFVNQGGFFRASYELIAGISDTTGKLITERVWSGRIEVDSIQDIRIRRPGEIVQKTINLAPGRYVFNIRVRDLETKKEGATRPKITVPDYGPGKWKLSDAMILRDLAVEDGRKVVTPNIGAAIPDVSDSFFVFLKLYNGLGVDSAIIYTEIRDRAAAPVRADTMAVGLAPGENSLLPSVGCRTLTAGEFTLAIRALPVPAPEGWSDGGLAETERTFTLRWMSAPVEVTDIDLAIDQMQYIMEKDDLEAMKALPAEAKREGWIAYWKRKDPTPGSDRNELMEEYYSRVTYANRQFGHYSEGWKTDMGMVYIIFGAPNNIERHPFEVDSKPYEIWTYYELNRNFIFVDASGFGDYRLQTQLWDVPGTDPR